MVYKRRRGKFRRNPQGYGPACYYIIISNRQLHIFYIPLMLSCRPWIIKYISLKLTGTKTHPFPQHKMAINYYGRFLSEFYNDPKGHYSRIFTSIPYYQYFSNHSLFAYVNLLKHKHNYHWYIKDQRM